MKTQWLLRIAAKDDGAACRAERPSSFRRGSRRFVLPLACGFCSDDGDSIPYGDGGIDLKCGRDRVV